MPWGGGSSAPTFNGYQLVPMDQGPSLGDDLSVLWGAVKGIAHAPVNAWNEVSNDVASCGDGVTACLGGINDLANGGITPSKLFAVAKGIYGDFQACHGGTGGKACTQAQLDAVGLIPGFEEVDAARATEVLGAARTGTVVFRTPRLGLGSSEFENGLDPSLFGIGDQSAYVGDEAAARTLADPTVGNYENGYTRFEMHPDFESQFSKYRYNYAEGGPGSYEYQIPRSMIPLFNELTLNRTWILFR